MPPDPPVAMPVDVILAAGASRRFGSPKLLARCAGRTLLQRAADAGRDAGLLTSFAVLGAVDRAIYDAAVSARVAFVVNPAWQQGQGHSVGAAVAALPDGAPAVLLRTVDQALIDGAALARLVAAWRDATDAIIAARYDGTLGAPAIFPPRCIESLSQLTADRGARGVIAADASVVAVDLPDAAVDVDTPDDLARAERLLLSRARAPRNARS